MGSIPASNTGQSVQKAPFPDQCQPINSTVTGRKAMLPMVRSLTNQDSKQSVLLASMDSAAEPSAAPDSSPPGTALLQGEPLSHLCPCCQRACHHVLPGEQPLTTPHSTSCTARPYFNRCGASELCPEEPRASEVERTSWLFSICCFLPPRNWRKLISLPFGFQNPSHTS